ncbi:tRNA threonylcarbamoyladenosine dehydratase [Bacillota bacterium]
MSSQFERTELLIGKEGFAKLTKARIAVFGVGGVGGYAVEALARSGVGFIDLFDNDVICLSNLNRQIIASHKTIGRYKVDVSRERILDINPKAVVGACRVFYSGENSNDINLSIYDYVIDAIDTVSSKIELIMKAKEAKVPIISSMGAGNKMDPSAFLVDDIYNTSVCPLAKVLRKELKNRGVESLKVVYSKETPIKPVRVDSEGLGRPVPGSNAFVPPAAGLVIAGKVIKDLIS